MFKRNNLNTLLSSTEDILEDKIEELYNKQNKELKELKNKQNKLNKILKQKVKIKILSDKFDRIDDDEFLNEQIKNLTCICGSVITNSSKLRHEKTLKHKKFVESNTMHT